MVIFKEMYVRLKEFTCALAVRVSNNGWNSCDLFLEAGYCSFSVVCCHCGHVCGLDFIQLIYIGFVK